MNDKIFFKKTIEKDEKTISFSHFNANDHIFKHFTMHKGKGVFYENYLLDTIKDMGIDGTYVDCGANIGNHSVYFLNFTKCQNLVSIEGHDSIFELLKKNVEDNRVKNKNVALINKLLGDKICNNLFINLSDNNNCGVGYVNKEIGIKKDMITIDSLNLKNVNLIKIDVENYEYPLLLGAKNTIEKYKPVIIIELHESNKFINEIKIFLKKHEYITDNVNYANSPTFIYKCVAKV